ncbi:unnamed protein product, partial [Laminaria digitata]
MIFPADKAFTFDFRRRDEDDNDISARYTSAGGKEEWETFVLPEQTVIDFVKIDPVEGPDEDDYPALRVIDCRVLGKHYSPGISFVASTANTQWDHVPDY